EFLRHVDLYGKSIIPYQAETTRENGDVIDFHTINMSLSTYLKLAENTYIRKGRKVKKKKTQKQMVATIRQIMFGILCMKNIPRIRDECETSIMFDPFETDANNVSIWGYVKGKVKGGPSYPVCIAADEVSSTFFNE
ncbi:MAG: hypothetical protein ACTSUE_09565, partial [Promethearchaeota archaeon]